MKFSLVYFSYHLFDQCPNNSNHHRSRWRYLPRVRVFWAKSWIDNHLYPSNAIHGYHRTCNDIYTYPSSWSIIIANPLYVTPSTSNFASATTSKPMTVKSTITQTNIMQRFILIVALFVGLTFAQEIPFCNGSRQPACSVMFVDTQLTMPNRY